MKQQKMQKIKMDRKRRRQQAMTLVEIMAVLVIIGLVATMVGVAVLPTIEKGKIKATRADAKAIAAAAQMYLMDNDNCPTVEDLVSEQILDKSKKTKDAWDNDFVIECEDGEIIAISSGPDKQMGTEDDIY